jgi:hypothetical protein
MLNRWPDAADVIVLPGIPGVEPPSAKEDIYPSDAIDLMKILREGGLRVEYLNPERERAEVAYRGYADYITPVLIFTQDALANGAGDLLAAAIRERASSFRRSDRKARMKVGKIESPDLTVKWLDWEGPADEAIVSIQVLADPRPVAGTMGSTSSSACIVPER